MVGLDQVRGQLHEFMTASPVAPKVQGGDLRRQVMLADQGGGSSRKARQEIAVRSPRRVVVEVIANAGPEIVTCPVVLDQVGRRIFRDAIQTARHTWRIFV